MRGIIAWGVAAGLMAAGCAGAASGPAAPSGTKVDAHDEAAERAKFVAEEGSALDELAASDPRFALRRGGAATDAAVQRAAVAALLAEDTGAVVHEGTLDFFSFDARARGIDRAAKIALGAKAPESMRLEQTLLARLLSEERARLEGERDLPRSASNLVRGIVTTWSAPASPEALKERDAWLGKRLDDVKASLAKEGLTRVELTELDDALDPLERLAGPSEYPSASAALASLRIALSNAKPAPAPTRDASWPRVDRALRAHLGVALEPAEIRARLQRGAAAVRALIDARITRVQKSDEQALMDEAGPLVLAEGRCGSPDSRVRALAPAPERAAVCGALHAIADASSDDAFLIALVALHFDATAAMWTLSTHDGALDPDRAAERTRPILSAPIDREARWIRTAAARPVFTIAAGLAVEMITRGAGDKIRDAARSWLAFGDAPFDVVERELFAGR